MLAWIARGLRGGQITTRYPRVRELPPPGFQGQVRLLHRGPAGNRLVALCPTGAISVNAAGELRLDRARCILCGACVRAAPERFGFERRYESAARSREALIQGPAEPERAQQPPRGQTLAERYRPLRRSVHVRHIDTGSDGAEEWELQALWNPYYDVARLGIFLTHSPRHADILVVTGGVTEAMRRPLELTWEAMGEPKALVAAGTDACSGGLSAATGLTAGGVDRVLPVDVYVPGSPPPPVALLDGLLAAIGLLEDGRAAADRWPSGGVW
jgi:Ni,Fe-hydrogenase III small subunit/ferredoxin